ncbi:MAG: Adenylate kinase [uncultured Corynebacteriales bacterium]|uniref:Adenylate kinase n=1 Tax=uncultured Mycobacteriales bacterium TaxID=581187 RepID=A0A6J4IC17_9ACTN|nr:MAG: Adenylate kinase [uncultured Corynebacteriales bacterium]
MRMLLIGAPGAGKGTQAELIATRFGITHISSGDLLRTHVNEGTAIGRQAKEYLARGDLVPDAVVMDMLRKPTVAATASGGYVLDGFPRTVDQAKAAYETARGLGVAVEVAVYLEVRPAELTRRLLARGRGQDDTPDVIEHRLEVFEAKTRPMLDYYQEREELITVNGARPVNEVAWSITVQLQQLARRSQRAGA